MDGHVLIVIRDYRLRLSASLALRLKRSERGISGSMLLLRESAPPPPLPSPPRGNGGRAPGEASS